MLRRAVGKKLGTPEGGFAPAESSVTSQCTSTLPVRSTAHLVWATGTANTKPGAFMVLLSVWRRGVGGSEGAALDSAHPPFHLER